EDFGVESKLAGCFPERVGAQRVLICIQRVVHLPEPALPISTHCGLRGDHRVGMDLRQGQMPEYQAHLALELGHHRAQGRLFLLTVRTLEVAEFDDGDGCVCTASNGSRGADCYPVGLEPRHDRMLRSQTLVEGMSRLIVVLTRQILLDGCGE